MRADRMNDVIRSFKEKEIIKELANADDKITAFTRARESLAGKLDLLQEIVKNRGELGYQYIFKKGEYTINEKNVLEICFICMMLGIKDKDMFEEYVEIPKLLENVEGKWAYVAKNIAYFMSEDDEGDLFSSYSNEQLLKRFFYKG